MAEGSDTGSVGPQGDGITADNEVSGVPTTEYTQQSGPNHSCGISWSFACGLSKTEYQLIPSVASQQIYMSGGGG